MSDLEMNQPERDPSPWRRLFSHGEAVGFIRNVGPTSFYSVDGYGWSGVVIPHDAQANQTAFRDLADRRVFIGDLVTMRIDADRDDLGQRVVLTDETHGVIFIDPRTGLVNCCHEIWPPPRRPQINAVEGSIYEDGFLFAQIVPLALAARNRLRAPHSEAIFDGLIIALGIGLAGFVQWLCLGEMGPILPMLGGQLAAALLVKRATHQNALWLNRKRLLGLAPRVGLVLGVILSLVYALLVFLGVGGLANGQEGIAWPVLGVGLLGALAGTIVMVIAADLKAWRGKGYLGEDS